MDKLEFIEQLSELIMMEMEAVLKSNIKYENDEAKEISVLLGDGSKLRITVTVESDK